MGIRKDMLKKETRIRVKREGIIVGRILQKKERWRIVEVYIGEGIEKTLKGLEQWMEEKEEEIITLRRLRYY